MRGDESGNFLRNFGNDVNLVIPLTMVRNEEIAVGTIFFKVS